MRKITFLLFSMLIFVLSWQGVAQTAGESCDNPIVVDSLPFDASGNTSTYGNNYSLADVPEVAPGAITNGTSSFGYYIGGDDVVFAYTPLGDEILNIETTNDNDWVGLLAFTGCPFDSTVGYHTATGGTTRAINDLPVVEGTTYYFVISTWPSPESTDFTINITKLSDCDSVSAGTPEEDSLTVCTGASFTVGVTGATEHSNGLSRIWQSSPSGDNDWADIDGETSESLTVTDGVLVATDYRYVVTCATSEESDESDVIQVSINPNITECYCEFSVSSTVEPITYVSFGDIDNTTAATSDIAYEDFTDQTTEVNVGESYEITLKGDTRGSFTNYFTVFIDWNQNGILDDEGEIYEIGSIQNSSGEDDISVTGNIEVPIDAISGNTRMRVVKNFNSSRTNPCGSVSYGQAEDYTLTVSGSDEDTFPSPYCDIADADSVIVEEITKVDLAGTTITNDDTESVLINKTDTVIDITAGETYTISVEGNTYGNFDTNILAFIDWNQNNTLDDEGEVYELGTLANSTGSDGIFVTMDILVPSDAVLGETRVRITKTYFDNISNPIINPCGIEFDPFGWGIESGYGQALDFTLNIEAANTEDCSGTPEGGIASVSPDSGEVSTDYTVSATGFTTGSGLTYQWQSNTDGSGWINEGNAEENYSPYMATAPEESDIVVEWRLEVTCTFSEETSYSEIATFTVIEPSLYCIPILDCSDGDMITNVTFLEINNTTTCSPNGYGDFTDMVATVGPGNTYPISVTVGDGWDTESVSVWIDFNDNGEFEEDEFFLIGTGSDEILTSEIVIPENITNGDYRMRVRVIAGPDTYATWDKACDSEDAFGETEDYTISVDESLSIDDYTITNFKYYPNPMTDVLHISTNETIRSISIYNMLGQEVLSNKHFNNDKVDTSSLPSGAFLLQVIFDNGHTESFKVLKK